VIDLHSHVLPGLDDGAATLDESLAIAAAAAADGVTVLAATPHVSARYPTAPDAMEKAFELVLEALQRDGSPIELVPGGELALDRLDALTTDDLERFALGGAGGGRCLLVEFPYEGWPPALAEQLSRLHAEGFRTLLAHPERNGEVQARPGRLEALVALGTLVQVTAASLDGRLGRTSQATAKALLDFGLVHVLASDAHGFETRAVGLAAARRRVGDEALGRWLTEDVPASIVAGDPPPPRPLRKQRRRLFRR
jgi:protein-tyrosine phosphatase